MRRLRLIKGWKDLPAEARGAAVAMGNFDGVHRGHQQVSALARALEAMGVDILYVLPMDAELAQMSDRQFATRVLHEGLGARHVAMGFDNSFGKDRTGSPQTMQAYGAELGFGVSVAAPVEDAGGEKLSSSAVRDALRDGRPEAARAILGRAFAIEGAVQRGRQLGRKLGFPPANVALGDYVIPRIGVYAPRPRLPD